MSRTRLLQLIAVNRTGKVRRATLNGRDHVVVPMTMLVPGVLAGSKGALYYPPDELARTADSWNGMPVVVNHPQQDGHHVSARTPEVMDRFGIGTVYNARVRAKDGALRGDAYLDVVETQRKYPDLLAKIESGTVNELSTGLFTNNRLAENGAVDPKGRSYTHVALNHRPDHLAVLTDEPGACSVRDGCGLGVNGGMKKKDRKGFTSSQGGDYEKGDRVHISAVAGSSVEGPAVFQKWKANGDAVVKLENDGGLYHMFPGRLKPLDGQAGGTGSCAPGQTAKQTGCTPTQNAADLCDNCRATGKPGPCRHGGNFIPQGSGGGMKTRTDKTIRTPVIGGVRKPKKVLRRKPRSFLNRLHKHLTRYITGNSLTTNAATPEVPSMNRKAIITHLTTNCDCWKGADGKKTLTGLSDVQLGAIMNAENVVTAVGQTYAEMFDGGELAVNAMPAFMEKTKAAMKKGKKDGCDEPVGSSGNSDADKKPKEKPVVNADTPKKITVADLPDDMQELLRNAARIQKAEKQKLIDRLTANTTDPKAKAAAVGVYAGMKPEQLEVLASSLPTANGKDDLINDLLDPATYTRKAAPLYGPTANDQSGDDDEDDASLIPFDWTAFHQANSAFKPTDGSHRGRDAKTA